LLKEVKRTTNIRVCSMITMVQTVIPAKGTGPEMFEAQAEWEGRIFTARTNHGASMALARQLVAARCPDQPWEMLSTSMWRLVFGNSLHRLAQLTISELERPRFTRWVPFAGKAELLGAASAGTDGVVTVPEDWDCPAFVDTLKL
jgi:hypothetical protein